jgi:hypothetical protein
MAIMDWTGYSDATKTGDNKYVVASFRADADLGWVVSLRSFLNIPEVKYREYLPRRQYVASNSKMQGSLNRGLAEAELTIVDVEEYTDQALLDLIKSGAEPGADFDYRLLHERAADQILRDSPFNLPSEETSWHWRANSVFIERAIFPDTMQDLSEFNPTEIRRRAGGKLRDVQVLVARANSMLSPTEYQELRIMVSNPMFRGRVSQNVERIKKLAHVFDAEHAKSVPLLNGLVGKIAEASGIPRSFASQMMAASPICEVASTSQDHIQAADMAAGWAADLLVATNNDYRTLARQVRWITVNGLSVPP